MKRVFVVMILVLIGLGVWGFAKIRSERPVDCGQYEDGGKNLGCNLVRVTNDKINYRLIAKSCVFKNKWGKTYLDFRINSNDNSRSINVRSLLTYNDIKKSVVKSASRRVNQDQHLEEYFMVAPSEVAGMVSGRSELMVTLYRMNTPELECHDRTLDSLVGYLEKPSWQNKVKYLVNSSRCPSFVSQINYY